MLPLILLLSAIDFAAKLECSTEDLRKTAGYRDEVIPQSLVWSLRHIQTKTSTSVDEFSKLKNPGLFPLPPSRLTDLPAPTLDINHHFYSEVWPAEL